MFGLTGATKYKYIPNYRDMRGGYDKLSGVVRTLGENPGKPPIQRKVG